MVEKNLNILIVDDMPYNVYCTVKMFNQLNKITTFEAFDGQEAVEKVEKLQNNQNQQNKIDFILMDINMPNMDGVEATKQIKQKHQKIWICMLTAFSEQQERNRAQQAGCNSFINKPLTLEKIYQELSKYYQQQSK